MTQHKLASQLRRRQIARGLVPRAMIASLSDEQIIDAYVTCPDCGAKQVEGDDLETAIATTENAHDFFRVRDALSRHDHGKGFAAEKEGGK